MGVHIERARILFQQSRWEPAEAELRKELASDPGAWDAHALLALCLAAQGRYDDATREGQEAIRLAPDRAFCHYALGHVYVARRRFREAEQCAREAIRLEPDDPDYFELLADVCFAQERWEDALEAAERGLALDAEHAGCTNTRAMALVKLGRRGEAGEALEGALGRDPENALTHANEGWRQLELGKAEKALEHFREALRLEPGNEWARQGIVEALKARSVIYSLVLRYFLWMAKLGGRVRWAVILGGYFGAKLLQKLARKNPDLAPFVWPILVLYVVFCLLTWLATPLFNLLLRLNRFGRLALSREETVASNWVGACLLVSLLSIALGAILGARPLLFTGLGIFALLIPLAATFACQAGWPRRAMGAYTALLAATGAAGLGFSLADARSAAAALFLVLFLVGVMASAWVANVLLAVVPRR
ncbi:MAG: tetratricopeptide repeat protein [Planctomycetes bacterium]|nr:tetratricopeptide repeat protein [Planctomycetota bacterium]